MVATSPHLTRTVARNLRFRIYKAEKLGTLIMTNIIYTFNIGIDISKKKLDISFNDNETASYDNDLTGFKQLLKQVTNKKMTRVVMEATGRVLCTVPFIQKTKLSPIFILKMH